MKKSEIEALSDNDLKAMWEQIKACYNNKTFVSYLPNHQSLILFANFVNVSTEINKRKL